MRPALHLADTGLDLGGRTVLDGIDLSVSPGEFVCLIGGSGSGKSSLLHLAAGLLAPSRGQVHVHAPRPALVFQEHALFPWLTARGNVELALEGRGVPRAGRAEQAAELLAAVQLSEAAGRLPHELSGGMRQRVALARALAQRSELLLMDEPFAALDGPTKDALHRVLTGVWRRHRPAVLLVTHQVEEAVALGDRVLLLGGSPARLCGAWPRGTADATTVRARLAETAGTGRGADRQGDDDVVLLR